MTQIRTEIGKNGNKFIAEENRSKTRRSFRSTWFKLTEFIRQFFESEVKGIGIVPLKDFTYPGAIKKLIFYHSHHRQGIANHIAWATALINFNASLPAVLNQCEEYQNNTKCDEMYFIFGLDTDTGIFLVEQEQ